MGERRRVVGWLAVVLALHPVVSLGAEPTVSGGANATPAESAAAADTAPAADQAPVPEQTQGSADAEPAAAADAGTDAQAVDPLFASTDVFRITLRGPLTALAADSAADPDYRPATLSFTGADGAPISLNVGLKVRGHSRRKESVCTFPPLRVDLPKRDATDGTIFENQGKLKLVTFCRPTERHQQFLFKEYLAYRMFDTLTDDNINARLVQIHYVNADREDASVDGYGMFLENEKRVGKRLGLPLREPEYIERVQLEPVHAARIEVFNYLLGNTDFSLVAAAEGRTCCHNIALFEQPDKRFLTIPYDFDMTGFVEPPYQMVSENLGISSVRQRLFRGYCREGDYTRDAAREIVAAKPQMLALVRDDPRLDDKTRKRALDWLESGFKILEDPSQLQRRVLSECRR
jgi:hypothetical protein